MHHYLINYIKNNNIIRITAILILIYLYCSVFNPFFYNAKGYALFCMQAYNLALNAAFICLCIKIRYVGLPIFIATGIYFGLLSYIYREFGYSLSNELIFATFETTTEESSAFITVYSVLFFILYIIFTTFVFYSVRFLIPNHFFKTRKHKLFYYAITAATYVGLYFLPSIIFHKLPWKDKTIPDKIVRELSAEHYKWMPFFDVPNQRAPYEAFTRTYRTPHGEFSILISGIKDYFEEINLVNTASYPSTCELQKDDELIVILVIGESVRADHMGMNGYHRNTTPKLKNTPGIIPLTRMYSYGGSTEFSFRSIMTGLTRENEQISRTSFVPILQLHHFHCSYYAENAANMCNSRHMKPVIGNFLNEGEIVKGTIAKTAGTISDKILNNKERRKFVIIQNGIGHYPYAHEKKYSIFSPSKHHTKKDDAQRTGLLNDYDNCIVAADDFLHAIITAVKDKKTILLYSSDHGELLGEDNKWNHGDPQNPYLRHVAAFVWMSDSYKAQYPQIAQEFLNIKDKPLVHGQFYATILKLCGIKTTAPLNIGDFFEDDIRNHENNLPQQIRDSIENEK